MSCIFVVSGTRILCPTSWVSILVWVAGRLINRCWLFIRCGVTNRGHGKGVPLETLFGGTVSTESLIELIAIFVDGLLVGAGAGAGAGAGWSWVPIPRAFRLELDSVLVCVSLAAR